MKNCPYQRTDNKGYINCTYADSHIGLCQNPCPYGYEAASSASDVKCSTFVNKAVSRRFRRKRRVKSRVKPLKNVLHLSIVAEGVDVYA